MIILISEKKMKAKTKRDYRFFGFRRRRAIFFIQNHIDLKNTSKSLKECKSSLCYFLMRQSTFSSLLLCLPLKLKICLVGTDWVNLYNDDEWRRKTSQIIGYKLTVKWLD